MRIVCLFFFLIVASSCILLQLFRFLLHLIRLASVLLLFFCDTFASPLPELILNVNYNSSWSTLSLSRTFFMSTMSACSVDRMYFLGGVGRAMAWSIGDILYTRARPPHNFLIGKHFTKLLFINSINLMYLPLRFPIHSILAPGPWSASAWCYVNIEMYSIVCRSSRGCAVLVFFFFA